MGRRFASADSKFEPCLFLYPLFRVFTWTWEGGVGNGWLVLVVWCGRRCDVAMRNGQRPTDGFESDGEKDSKRAR